MAVRSVMQILEAHEKAKAHCETIRQQSSDGVQTVFQSREHAPKAPSFNQRKLDTIRPMTPQQVGHIADHLVDCGDITPHQRYDIALQRDIG